MPADRSPLVVHYHRPEGDYAGWNLWVWNDVTHDGGRELAPTGRDDFGLVFTIEPAAWARSSDALDPIGFLPRRNHWEERDGDDRVWRPADPPEAWIKARRPGSWRENPGTAPFIVGGFVDGPEDILVELYPGIEETRLATTGFRVTSPSRGDIPVRSAAPAGGDSWIGHRCHRVRLSTDPVRTDAWPIGPLRIVADGYEPGLLRLRHVLDLPAFRSDAPMGAVAGDTETTWRVFAPEAIRMELRLYDAPTGGSMEKVEMTREAEGTWHARVPRDASGTWFDFVPDAPPDSGTSAPGWIDPWARAASVEGRRARVVRPGPPPAPGPSFPLADAVVYEVHLRDLTVSPDAGCDPAGGYLGLAAEGTRIPGDPATTTGLDHLVELGINTVQVMPVTAGWRPTPGYDWGYMPILFGAPEAAYASDGDPVRAIEEWKRAIDACHRRGLRVVMDIVVNHTAELPPDRWFGYEPLARDYFHRIHADGTFWNGSGTGNEFRSEAPMAQRLVLDSLRRWVTEFGVDGFRFDLMGLIELDTMKAIVRELRGVKPDILLWGEPWTAAPTPIAPTLKGSQRGEGFAVFNDHFRNALRGDGAGALECWLAGGARSGAFRRGFEGSVHDFAGRPVESVNYVECHDNQTLWDRLAVLPGTRELDDATRIRLHRLAGAAVLLARGIPFLHAGQEFLRTKGGIDDSYDKGDEVNRIEWTRKRRHADVVRWHRDLIALRRAHALLRRSPEPGEPRGLAWLDDDLGLAVPDPVVAACLERGSVDDSWAAAIVAFNPGAEPRDVALPAGAWVVIVDGDAVDDSPLHGRPHVADRIAVPARSVLVLARGG
jgi:pullulanase